MSKFAFKVGLTLRNGLQTLEFVRLLDKNEVQFEDPITRRVYVWEISKVTSEILAGKLALVGGSEPNTTRIDGSQEFISSLDSLPAKYKEDLQRKIDVIKWLKKNGISLGQRKAISSSVKKLFELRAWNTKQPSSSTVMAWMREWEASGCNPVSLVSKNFQRKRTKPFDAFLEDEIRSLLRKEYFVRSRPSLERVYLILQRLLEKLSNRNANSTTQNKMSLSSLRRRVQEVDPYVRDTLRYGAAYAKNKWRYSLSGNYATRALQRLEVDHTILDIVVIADGSGMPLGRPVITIIVDSYSGYVVGFYISFAGPGLAPVLNAMKVALMPKNVFTNGSDTFNNEWLGYGIGELYVVDNGLEFHSKQFVYAALELNSDIQYCPVRQPWFKPTVERFFRELGYHIPDEGKVYKPLANYLPLDPNSTARISFSELCKGLLKFFVDIHATKVHSRKLARPFDLFKESFETLPPPLLPTNLERFGLIAAQQKQLIVGNEGVVMNYLRFNSAELQAMRRKIGIKFKTNIKYDPENLGYCYVQHPQKLDWLYVPNCHPEYAENLSMLQHRAIREKLKNDAISGDKYEAHLRAKIEFIEMWESIVKGKQITRDTKSALHFSQLSSTKALTTEPKIFQEKKVEIQLVTPENFKVTKRDVPTFTSFILD